ncbi:MAG: hypothetical protein AABY86_02655, partial [Bdellovibrionota bacterium]
MYSHFNWNLSFVKAVLISSLCLSASSGMAQLSRCENIDRVAYPRDWQFCMRAEAGGGGGGGAGGSYSGYDCIDCEAARAPEGPSPWVEALGIVAGPLAMVGSVWLGSYYQNRTQEAWAGAYTRGHEECTSRYNS